MQQLFCLPPTILFRFLFFLSFQPFLVLSPSTFVTSSSLPRQQKQHRPGKQRHGPVLWPLCVLADQLVVLLPSLAVVVCFVTAGLWITRADNTFFLFLLKHQTSGFFCSTHTLCRNVNLRIGSASRIFAYQNFLLISGTTCFIFQ